MKNTHLVLMILLFVVIYIVVLKLDHKYNIYKETFKESLEGVYADGQKDALKGDYKIKYDSINKTWYWIASPWSDTTIKPTYDLNKTNK